MGKFGHTLFLFSLPYICINLSKNVDLTLSLRESVERTSYVWPYPAVTRAPEFHLYLVQFLLLNVDEHVGVGTVAGSHHLLPLAAEVVVDRLLLGTS